MSSGIDVGKIEAQLSASPDQMVQGIAKARSALDAIRGELKRLDEEFKRGAISATAHTQRFGDLQAATVRLQAAMNGAFTSLQATGSGLDTISAKAAQTRTAFGGIGQTMLQVGYAIDDVRYGLGAVVNNAGQLTGSLAGALNATAGQAAAAAGTVQILAVGIYELYQHSDKLYALLGLPVFKTAAEEMEELGKKTAKTADETKRLAEYEETRAKAKKRTESDTASEKSEKEIDKTIADAGGESVRMGIENALLEEGGGKLSDKEEQDIRKKTRGMFGHIRDAMPVALGGVDIHEEEEKALAEARQKRLEEQTKDLMGGKDAASKKKRIDLIKKHPKFFKEGLASELEAAEPEASKKREEEHQQHEWERQGRKSNEAYVKKQKIKEERERRESTERDREWRKENVEVARKVLPGFDKEAEDTAAVTVKAGQTREQAIAEFAMKLQKGHGGKFMNQKDAYEAAKDTVGKMYDEFKADPDKLKAHEKQRHREAKEKAEEAMPGLGDRAVSLVAQDRIKERARKEAKAREANDPFARDPFALPEDEKKQPSAKEMIEKELLAKGLNPKEAALAAEDAVKQGQHDLDKKITHNQLHKKAEKSEVFNTNDLTERIQAGVGGDEASKQTGLQEKMVAYLTRIAEQEQKGVLINLS